MIPIYTAEAFREWDQFTMEKKGITSAELMEKAAVIFVDWLLEMYSRPCPIALFCGTGNNGGDGLAIGRLLAGCGFQVQLFVFAFSERSSADFQYQLKKLPAKLQPVFCSSVNELPELNAKVPIVEAIFGTGLNRPVTEPSWTNLITYLNQLPNPVISVDLPAGLLVDKATDGACVHADYTLTFEAPKLAFFLPENAHRVGTWSCRSIGLDSGFLQQHAPSTWYLERSSIAKIVKSRRKFDHKGTFGHALLVVGSKGKMGAAILSAKAALRTGLGLLTVHLPESGLAVVQTAVPEAMCTVDPSQTCFSRVPLLGPYKAIGIGCGLGTSEETVAAFKTLLSVTEHPMVLDADALNILAVNPDFWGLVPKNSLLTPHPKEFDRLFGASATDFERLEKQRAKSQAHGVYLIRKGAYTVITAPDGIGWVNSTGNPGMATAGSGDVLTGILTSLLSQGYTPEETALLGVFLHGLAGDLGSASLGETALLASDLVQFIGPAYLRLTSEG